jgi:hypothetical protein
MLICNNYSLVHFNTYLSPTAISRYSSVGIGYGLNYRGVGFDSRQRYKIFIVAIASRPALWLTQPPIQRVPGTFFPWWLIGRGVKLTTHQHLVLRLRKAELCLHSLIRLYCVVENALYDRFNVFLIYAQHCIPKLLTYIFYYRVIHSEQTPC